MRYLHVHGKISPGLLSFLSSGGVLAPMIVKVLLMQSERSDRSKVSSRDQAFEKLLKKLEGVPTPAEITCSDPGARPQGRSLPVLHQN